MFVNRMSIFFILIPCFLFGYSPPKAFKPSQNHFSAQHDLLIKDYTGMFVGYWKSIWETNRANMKDRFFEGNRYSYNIDGVNAGTNYEGFLTTMYEYFSKYAGCTEPVVSQIFFKEEEGRKYNFIVTNNKRKVVFGFMFFRWIENLPILGYFTTCPYPSTINLTTQPVPPII